ncbi:MAG TPA: hypothetical protein DCS97_08330 [Planctomycetes bacterium]|nr:hypothetical protein [Planctomycetota bacterium]
MPAGIGPLTSPAAAPLERGLQGKQGEERTQARRRQAGELTPDQRRVVAELQARDAEVRAHEAAHKAAGGSLAGGMSFSYQSGPDGRRYAVGGEVAIDTGAERDPQATIAKMQRVIAAALAPAQPSSQDRAVAAQARATMTEAQRQQMEQSRGAGSVRAAYTPTDDRQGGLVDLTA